MAERCRTWTRIRCILIIRTDSTTGLSCCAAMIWPIAVTGRLSGAEDFTSPSLTEESAGKEVDMSVCLEGMISPGVWSALILLVTPSGIVIRQHTSPPLPPPPPLRLTGWQCMWTILLALCRFTEFPLTHWPTCTPSTPHSPNLFTPGSGSGPTGRVPQCLCVLCRRKRLLLLEKLSLLNRQLEMHRVPQKVYGSWGKFL